MPQPDCPLQSSLEKIDLRGVSTYRVILSSGLPFFLLHGACRASYTLALGTALAHVVLRVNSSRGLVFEETALYGILLEGQGSSATSQYS